MGNPIVHFEISGRDGEVLSEFYSSLFGWNINDNTHGIYSVDPEVENGVDGHIFTTTDDTCSDNGVTIYIEVDDLQASLEKVESCGGKSLCRRGLFRVAWVPSPCSLIRAVIASVYTRRNKVPITNHTAFIQIRNRRINAEAE